MTYIIPPIKSQGIKTKLTPWIKDVILGQDYRRWVEPFMGTGAVAFNIQPKAALLCDSNPYIIKFYRDVQNHKITPEKVRKFLTDEGEILLQRGDEYYYRVRERFNANGHSLDFLFLTRSCFNGMMRFNKKGGFNTPFCRKLARFSKSLVTKITNQVEAVSHIINHGDYVFKHEKFDKSLKKRESSDMIYCDPPYIGRHVNYFDSWSEDDEIHLYKMLTQNGSRFLLSTWLKNRYRRNDFIFSLWGDCSMMTKRHFYHIGGSEKNRHAIVEALLMNFHPSDPIPISEMNEESDDSF